MPAVDIRTRVQVRRALEGDSGDAEHDALVAVADDLAIRWCSIEDREAASDALASAGHRRLAARLRSGASVEAVRASAEQQQDSDALATIAEVCGEPEPAPDNTEPAMLAVSLLGQDEEVLAELGPFAGSVIYSCGGEHEGPAIRAEAGVVVAHNDNVNPGLWANGVLHDCSGFSVELRESASTSNVQGPSATSDD